MCVLLETMTIYNKFGIRTALIEERVLCLGESCQLQHATV